VAAGNYHFQLFTTGVLPPAFHFWLSPQTILRSAWNDKPLRFLALTRGIRSLARLLTISEMTLMITESLWAARVPKGARYQHTRLR